MLSFPRILSREIRPWARLFDELDSIPQHHPFFRSQNLNLTSFTPNFDVKETKDSYVLDGEIPGVKDKSSLDLSFVDANTLVIKGRVERTSESGNPSSDTTTVTEPTEKEATTNYHAPSVEAEEGETNTSSAVTKSQTSNEIEKKEDGDKYWVRERYVGEFQRAFSFPQSVDHDAVKASLKDGILSIVVPKKLGPDGARKINIE